MCVCVSTHALTHVPWDKCGGHRTACSSLFSFHHMSPGDQTQAIRLGSSQLYPLDQSVQNLGSFEMNKTKGNRFQKIKS